MFHSIVVLYNCPSLAGSCSQCLAQIINTGFQCGWCQLDFKCTGDNTCAGGPSNWLTVSVVLTSLYTVTPPLSRLIVIISILMCVHY